METEKAVVVRVQNQLRTMEDVAAEVKAIETCIKTMMVEKRHYGTVPGCGDKKSLLKPGAEMLAKLFNIRPEFKRERRDLGNGHVEWTSTCIMFSRVTGQPVGEGAGTCSTMEKKYRWRKSERSCPKCDGTILRSKYPPQDDKTAQPGWYCKECKSQFLYGDPEIRGQQTGRSENPDIADQYNTVQKMADKRGYVAAVITTTGASDYVTQDMDDDDTDTDHGDQPGKDDAGGKSGSSKTGSSNVEAAKAEIIKQAEVIIGDGSGAVTIWAIDTGKIKSGQTWKDMDILSINTIVKSGKGFMVAVNNHIDQKNQK